MYNFIKSKVLFASLSILNLIIPKKKRFVFVHDKFFKKDNAWSLANYIVSNELKEDYEIYYYTEELIHDLPDNFININEKKAAIWYQLRSNTIIYSYRGDGIYFFKSCRSQKIIDTMHGSPLKTMGYVFNKSKKTRLWRHHRTFDYILAQSDFFKEVIMRSFGSSETQTIVTGLPRNDEISDGTCIEFSNIMNLNVYESTIMWLPTWRESIDSNENTEKFPVLNESNIDSFNEFLKRENILLMIKPHPYQRELKLFELKYSNIKIISNNVLSNNNITFYSTFGSIDALITDYSSVYFDFLLTNKPIGFTVDDIEYYSKTHGFNVEKPLDIMPGPKISKISDLEKFAWNVKNDVDLYRKERARILELSNKYVDSESCKRVVDKLGL